MLWVVSEYWLSNVWGISSSKHSRSCDVYQRLTQPQFVNVVPSNAADASRRGHGNQAEDVESNDADVNREDGAGKQAHPGLAGFGVFCDM